ncbi:MAG: aminotransferase class III-fold pyridoxal phosphate-dependent enzyme, partial [Geobacteraceae bacterium]|nr:aminotransferase class III-fold pyridoxal phosphate-dependent enzyme [Geobacteraceae bacterium]
MATIDVIREEGLLVRSSEIGAEILERLRRLADSYPLVGDVRGYGYMIGIEFSGTDGAPNGAACRRVMDACLEKGLVLIGCGLERNVIRFIPPLNVSREDMETALSILEEAIQGLQ